MKLDSLSKKAALSILIILFPIAISFIIGYQSNKKYVEKSVSNAMMVIAEAYEGQVYQYIDMSRRRAEDFASDGFLRDSLRRIINGDKAAIHQLKDHLQRNKMPLDSSIRLIYVLSTDGRIAASTDDMAPGTDVSDSDFYKYAVSNNAVMESGKKYNGKPLLSISSPVKDRVNGEPLGFIINFIHLEDLSRLLLGDINSELGAVSWNKGRPETMETYLVNRDRFMITDSHFVNDAVLRQKVDSLPVNKCLESDEEVAEFYTNSMGKVVSGVSMCFPIQKWTLLVEVDKDEVMKPLGRLQTSAISGAIILFFFTVILLFLFSRNVVTPLRRLASASDNMALGNFDVSVPVSGSDEIGTLAGSFNRMARELDAKISDIKKLSMAIEHSVDMVFITDTKGDIEYVNQMFEKITGWPKDDIIGRNARILSSGETTKIEYEELWQTIKAGRTWKGIFKNKKRDGSTYCGNGLITPIKNSSGDITHFLSVQEDTTEKRMTDERLQYLATRDELTGLLNRTRFIEVVNEFIYESQADLHKGVLILVDIDEFKDINNIYGHGVGDELVRYAAKLIEDSLIGKDVLCENKTNMAAIGRLGGDEFAVFLSGVDAVMGIEAAERIRRNIEGFKFPVLPIKLTASIGVVSYPEHGDNLKMLFTKVNAAIYRAKEAGRNRCHLYHPEDKDLEDIRSRVNQKQTIHKALEEGRIVPWFQPLLDLKDNKVHHYEALARIQNEGGKILLPIEFIDTAERFGMIGAIDRVITEKTMLLQAEMDKIGLHYSFAMNLSGKNLGSEDLLTFLKAKIEDTGADPNRLIFEITETAAVRDLSKAVTFVTALRKMGCKFSLDDFGVGFTSFIYLKELNVNYIKIDGSFVKRLNENPSDQLIIKAITGLAKGMGIETIAEFVEKEETLELLRELGVDYAQGYFIGRPGEELLKNVEV